MVGHEKYIEEMVESSVSDRIEQDCRKKELLAGIAKMLDPEWLSKNATPEGQRIILELMHDNERLTRKSKSLEKQRAEVEKENARLRQELADEKDSAPFKALFAKHYAYYTSLARACREGTFKQAMMDERMADALNFIGSLNPDWKLRVSTAAGITFFKDFYNWIMKDTRFDYIHRLEEHHQHNTTKLISEVSINLWKVYKPQILYLRDEQQLDIFVKNLVKLLVDGIVKFYKKQDSIWEWIKIQVGKSQASIVVAENLLDIIIMHPPYLQEGDTVRGRDNQLLFFMQLITCSGIKHGNDYYDCIAGNGNESNSEKHGYHFGLSREVKKKTTGYYISMCSFKKIDNPSLAILTKFGLVHNNTQSMLPGRQHMLLGNPRESLAGPNQFEHLTAADAFQEPPNHYAVLDMPPPDIEEEKGEFLLA